MLALYTIPGPDERFKGTAAVDRPGKCGIRCAAIGGPILLAGTMVTLFRSLDKLMILGYHLGVSPHTLARLYRKS